MNEDPCVDESGTPPVGADCLATRPPGLAPFWARKHRQSMQPRIAVREPSRDRRGRL